MKMTMPPPKGEYAEVPKGWYPQSWGAHLARIEFMKEMGQEHYSRTDPQWHVQNFRTTVANEECDRWAKAMEKLGFRSHPGLSVEENLWDFARWARKNKMKGEL